MSSVGLEPTVFGTYWSASLRTASYLLKANVVPFLLVTSQITSVNSAFAGGAVDSQAAVSHDECQIVEVDKPKDTGWFPWELMKKPAFKKPYLVLLGDEPPKKHWLLLSGPAPRSKSLTIAKHEFEYVWSCKQHECDTHSIHLLFNIFEGDMYGMQIDNSTVRFLGAPSECVRKTFTQLLRSK